MSHTLENYLRTYRKRAGFSQDEVAFLLGGKSGSKVSRYERFGRRPSLRIVFAYEVIFHAPASNLFAGIYQGVEKDTLARMRTLSRKLEHEKSSRLTAHKVAALKTADQKKQPRV